MAHEYSSRRGDTKLERQAKRSFRDKIRATRRKLLKERRKKDAERTVSVAKIAARKYGAAMVEEFCKQNNMSRWAGSKRQQRVIRLNKDFSLFHNPEQVLGDLVRLLHDAKTFREYPTIRYEGAIHFGALYLVDTMCWEIAKHRQWKVIFENMPEHEQVKLNKIQSFETTDYDNPDACMVNERVYINRKDDDMAKQSYRTKSKALRDMVEAAIATARGDSFEFPPEATQAIDSAISEHFDNVIQHVPDAEHASLCCFYDKRTKELTILIFNFGNTIAQTLGRNDLPAEMKTLVNEVISNHTLRLLFRMGSPFTEENALTLLALQEGVSSRLKYDKTRGHGLIDYIEHCFELSPACRIAIISGRTAIKIDGKYPVAEKFIFGRKRRVIALNEQNDLYVKPDKNYVSNLNVRFPGLIIETTIPLSY